MQKEERLLNKKAWPCRNPPLPLAKVSEESTRTTLYHDQYNDRSVPIIPQNKKVASLVIRMCTGQICRHTLRKYAATKIRTNVIKKPPGAGTHSASRPGRPLNSKITLKLYLMLYQLRRNVIAGRPQGRLGTRGHAVKCGRATERSDNNP